MNRLCDHGMFPGLCVRCGATPPDLEKIERVDVAMVLGAGYNPVEDGIIEGRPASDLLNYESKLRLDAGAFFFTNKSFCIMTTGGPGISEQWQGYPALGDLGKDYLMEKFGFCSGRIFVENESDATHGNLTGGLRAFLARIEKFGQPNPESLVIVSSAYHKPRTEKMLEEMGVAALFVPAETIIIEHQPERVEEINAWLDQCKKGPAQAERQKILDENYWNERRPLFQTPLDKPTPRIDITADVARTKETLAACGASSDVQTGAF